MGHALKLFGAVFPVSLKYHFKIIFKLLVPNISDRF